MLERVQTDGSPPALLVGMEIESSTRENSMEVLSNVRHTGTEHRSGENHNFLRHLQANGQGSTRCNSQDVGAA